MNWSLILEIVLTVFSLLALILTFNLAGVVGNGVANLTFYFLGFCIIVLGLARLFLFLNSGETAVLSDVTMHIWWHLISYIAIGGMVWAGHRQHKAIEASEFKPFGRMDTIIMAIGFGLIGLIFIAAAPLEPILGPALTGSVIDTFGFHHFLVVVLGFFAANFIYNLRSSFLSSMLVPTMLFLSLIGVQHLWELVTESWRLIDISDSIIEMTEQVILILGYAILSYGLMKSLRLMLGGKKSA